MASPGVRSPAEKGRAGDGDRHPRQALAQSLAMVGDLPALPPPAAAVGGGTKAPEEGQAKMFIKDLANNVGRRCDVLGEPGGRQWTVIGAWERPGDRRHLVRHDNGQRRLVSTIKVTNLY